RPGGTDRQSFRPGRTERKSGLQGPAARPLPPARRFCSRSPSRWAKRALSATFFRRSAQLAEICLHRWSNQSKSGEQRTSPRPPGPSSLGKPFMSLLGKILAIFNVLAAVAFFYVASIDWAKHEAWADAALQHDLVIQGLPVDDQERDAQGNLRVE